MDHYFLPKLIIFEITQLNQTNQDKIYELTYEIGYDGDIINFIYSLIDCFLNGQQFSDIDFNKLLRVDTHISETFSYEINKLKTLAIRVYDSLDKNLPRDWISKKLWIYHNSNGQFVISTFVLDEGKIGYFSTICDNGFSPIFYNSQ